MQIWDTPTTLLLHTLSGHHREVYALEFVPDRHTLISASTDRTLLVWDISSPSSNLYTEPVPSRTLSVKADATHPDTGICALAVSPDGTELYVCGNYKVKVPSQQSGTRTDEPSMVLVSSFRAQVLSPQASTAH